METSYEGGVGGKLRRRPFRRPSTPYDRPPAALANPNGNQRSGWLSKLVDPASRIISSSASKLFSSVLRNRLPAPATLPEVRFELRNELHGESCINPPPVSQEQGNGKIKNQSHSFESSGINELEQLLEQKTFTRAEFDRLTELLRSRTIDLPNDDENKATEPSTPQPVAIQARDEETVAAQENRTESIRLFESISTPPSGLLVPEEETASPAELAKAYMGSRPSKLLPPSFRNQMFREDPPLLNIVPFAPKSPNMLHTRRPAGSFSGVRQLSENHYQTPRSLRRSAMYNMTRSPYTQSHSKATHKVSERTDDALVGSRTSQWTQVNSTPSIGNQVLKRTSSVLDSDFGSVGPIRRIRQKSNLMSPSMYVKSSVPRSPPSIAQTPFGSDSVQCSISAMQKPPLLNGPKHTSSKVQVAENEDNEHSAISSASVHHLSSEDEVGMKIMQQLVKLVPSLKYKPLESRVAMVWGNSTNKLNRNMLNGQSSKSLSGAQFPALGNSISVKQDSVEVNGPVKNVDTGLTASSVANSAKNAVKDTLTDARPVDSLIFGSTATLPQNKQGFQMHAPVGAVEFNDDSFCSKNVFTPLSAEKVKTEPYLPEKEPVVAETVKEEKPLPSSSERQRTIAADEVAETVSGSADCSAVPVKDASFASAITSAADTTKSPPQIPAAPLSPLFNQSTPKEQPATSLFSFGSKNNQKGPTSTFSPTNNCINGTSALKSVDSNSKMLNSAAAKEMTALEATGSDKDDKNLEGGDLNESFENAITGISPSATKKIFYFGASTSASLSNGSPASTFLSSSVSAAPETSSFGTSTCLISSGNGAAASGCSSSSPIATATPVFSAAPVFKFGSADFSAAAFTSSVSPPASTSILVSTDSELKTKQTSLLFSNSGSSIPAAISALAHTGSSIFSFGASVSSSPTSSFPASNLSQSSTLFGATAGSVFGTTSGITPFTQSMQSRFGSSLAPSLGLSGSSSFSSAGSLFPSASSSAKLFGSGSGCGLSSASSTAGSGSSVSGASFSFAPASSTASSSFSSSHKPSTSSIFSSGFGSTSTKGFSFGASTAAAGSTPSTIASPLGTSSGSLFSFTSAAAPSSLSPSQPVFGILNRVVDSGSSSPGNDQMNVEDSMAEDIAQVSAVPVAPTIGQLVDSPSPLKFSLGSPSVPTSGSPIFQFGGHQNMAAPQNSSTFPGGSFSLGTGSADKSTRRIVKINRDKLRKKYVP